MNTNLEAHARPDTPIEGNVGHASGPYAYLQVGEQSRHLGIFSRDPGWLLMLSAEAARLAEELEQAQRTYDSEAVPA